MLSFTTAGDKHNEVQKEVEEEEEEGKHELLYHCLVNLFWQRQSAWSWIN